MNEATSMKEPEFKPGFRFSVIDGIVLVVGLLALLVTPSLAGNQGLTNSLSAAVVVPFVAFFLFCNVFRVSRPLELIWAGLFIGLAAAMIRLGTPSWSVTNTTSLAAVLGAIVVQVRKPSYHGIAWQLINPKLPEWWKQNNIP